MAPKKKAALTIVEAYKQLNEILTAYSNQIEDTAGTVSKIDTLSAACREANLPFNLSIGEDDLNETGINPSPEPSYQSSYEEPESSEKSSY